MKTITINLYSFNELSEEAKKKALNKQWDINVSDDWWENTYMDAKESGLNITGFDIERGSYCNGELIGTPEDTAISIIENHGKDCGTFKLAQAFLLEYRELNKDLENNEGLIDDIEVEFTKNLLEEYLIILRKEYEYLTSEEAIIETIEANDYTFEEDGTMNNS